MRIIRRMLYVAVALVTLSLGIGVVAGVRLTYAAMLSLATSYRAKPLAEPLSKIADSPQLVTPEFVSDESCGGVDSASSFDPTGDYSLDADVVPKTFADIEYLTIQTREYYQENGEYLDRPIVPSGSIRTKTELKFARLAVGDSDLTFQTDTVNGVSYRFVGRFLREENFESEAEMPDLTGRLIKITNGKWAAEMDAKFYIQCGC